MIGHKDEDSAYFRVFLQNNTIHIGIEDICSDDIIPIPLTPEILEKNRFVYNDENAKYHPNCWSNNGTLLRKRTLNGFFYMVTSDYDDQDTNSTPIIVTYVHELQHLLKLCGIDKTIEL